MAQAGAFGPAFVGVIADLTYWQLTGGFVAGEARTLFKGDPQRIAEAVATAATKLHALVAAFDDPAKPYLSVPHPGRAPRFADYRQLARRAEWDVAGEEA